jgi:LysR family glycine cleavage system transcriptional activator
LHAGDVDFVIRYSRSPPAGLKATMLFRDTYSPVASPAFLEGLSNCTSPQDLSEARLIAFDWRSGDPNAPSWERWLAEALPKGAAPSTVLDKCQWLRVTEESQAIELALAGKGLALVSNILVAREIDTGDLRAPFDVQLDGFGFWVTHLPTNTRVDLIEAFAAWARAAA